MNPENSQPEHMDEVIVDAVEDAIEEAVEEVSEEVEGKNKVNRTFHATGPVARFVQNDALKPLLENDLVKSFEAWNVRMSQRFGMSGNAISVAGLIAVLLLLSLVMRVDTLHVSLAAEIVKPGGKYVTNSFVHMILVDLILLAIVYSVTKFKTDASAMSLIPRGFQNVVEAVFDYLYGLCESVAGHNARRFAPWCLTLFFFITISNWSGLIPGVGTIGVWHDDPHAAEHGDATHEDGAVHDEDAAHEEEGDHAEEGDSHGEEGIEDDDHGEEEEEGDGHGQLLDGTMADRPLGNQLAMSNGSIVFASAESIEAAPAQAGEGGKVLVPLFRPPTASLNFTFAIAIMTMVIVQYYGFKKLGMGYLQKFFTLRGEGAMKGINAFVGILELVSELSRILSFAFRLFGNIFAGEVMLATMAFLITFILPVPFYFLELFVGFVQALVFMMLALIFFSLAEHSHGDEHH